VADLESIFYIRIFQNAISEKFLSQRLLRQDYESYAPWGGRMRFRKRKKYFFRKRFVISASNGLLPASYKKPFSEGSGF
jgi:hypothetical protein